jgi:lipid-A-disaccharide synthase
VVPELLQDAAHPAALADAVWRQLSDAANRSRLQERFADLHQRLLRDTAKESAEAVLQVIAGGRR